MNKWLWFLIGAILTLTIHAAEVWICSDTGDNYFCYKISEEQENLPPVLIEGDDTTSFSE